MSRRGLRGPHRNPRPPPGMPQEGAEDGSSGLPAFVLQDGVGLWNNGPYILAPTHIRHVENPKYYLRFGSGRILLWQAEACTIAVLLPAVFTQIWSGIGTMLALCCSWFICSLVYSVVFNPCYLLNLINENRQLLVSDVNEITELDEGTPSLGAYFKVRCYIKLLDLTVWLIVYLMTFCASFTANGVMSYFWGNVLQLTIQTSFFYSIFLVSFLYWMNRKGRRIQSFPEAVSVYSIFLSAVTPMLFHLDSITYQQTENYPVLDIMVSLGSVVVVGIRLLAVAYDAAEEYLTHDFGEQVRAILQRSPEKLHYYVSMVIMFCYRLWNHFQTLERFVFEPLGL